MLVRALLGFVLGWLWLCPPALGDNKHVRVGDADLAYVEAGKGVPIVFVHGGLQDYRLWSSHLPAFASRYRAIAYSRANHFPNVASVDGTPDGAADLHGADLATFVESLGLAPVHIVAHSSGAHAALFFAATHPGMVRSLVINEPPASGLLTNSPEGRQIAKDFSARLAPAFDAFRAGNTPSALRLFADGVGGPGTYDRRSEAARSMMLDNALAHAADATTSRPRPVFSCESARRISAPVLLTEGTRSPDFFHRILDELQRCLPHSERIAIDASHTVPGENPKAFDDAVLGFLSKH
jgi:pimeloyl-ACP methyl ester carboxylesterase